MQHSHSNLDSSDAVSSGLGFIMSVVLSTSFLSFAQEAGYAFVFGVVGALGGWMVNKFVLKPIEKRLRRAGWLSE